MVVPAFDIRQHVNPETKKLIDDAIEILDRRKAGSLTKRGASNKIKEDIGEYRAMQRISNRFPSARSILVATRPNSVPIVDLLFETPDGRFIIVEAKFSSSGSVHFGRTNTSLWEFTPDGWHEVVPPPKTTVQMSPQWINNRVLELERSGKPGARRLAARLKQALFAGQVEAYTVLTDRTGEVLRTLDHTPELVSAFRRPGVQFRPQSTVAASVVGERGVGATERAVRDRGPGVGERSIEGRTAAAEAMDGPIGHRVDPGVEAAVRESAEVAASEGAEVAIREGGTIAARKGVVGRSARTVGRVLLGIVRRAIPILDMLDMGLLAAEIVGMLWNHLKDQAVNEAIDRAMRINVPGEISSALRQHADEVAHYFAQAWTQRSPTLATFLYLSPRMLVDGGPGNDGFKFDAHVKVQSIERDLVSIGAVEPSRRTIQDGPSYYEIEVRWSISQPIFTPFDIYRALVEYFAEHIVDSWVAHCYSGSKLSKDAKEDFYGCTAILAEVSATLKCEGYFALDAGDRSYLSQARSLRWEALQKLSVMIENELIPRVRRLESKRLISMDIIRWDAYWSSTRKGLDLGGERSLIPTMERVSLSMSHVEGKDLEYERLETSKWRADPTMRPFAVNNISHIAAQKRHELREFLKPLERYVPNLIPKEDTHVFDLSKPSFDS